MLANPSAEAYGKIGQAENGLSTVADAFAAMNKNEEHFYEAELYRVKGDLLLLSGNPSRDAEACFDKAIDIARGQNTKIFELRAATSLSCLWQKLGKRQEAQQLLGEIYSWFTEGFDSADLKKAERLLNGLN
jgi:predicted ATPase